MIWELESSEQLRAIGSSNSEKSAGENPKIEAAVESQVSKGARPGAPGLRINKFACVNLRLLHSNPMTGFFL